MAIQDQMRGECRGRKFHIMYREEYHCLTTSIDGLPFRVKTLTVEDSVDQALDNEAQRVSRLLNRCQLNRA